MRTIIFRPYASQGSRLPELDANQFGCATAQLDSSTCGTIPFLTNAEFRSQTLFSESQCNRMFSFFARGTVEQEMLAGRADA
jgi:hypothetical protein